ncbi:uncharacterized protein N7482_004251 [Penicillium canariense]|uniref:Cytochrome P450 n=1 Tax=Penicillium canariense TaxID=189055 RepID=A0A9W9LPE2_9EURO|nr:uncharacterized protein N7482_004251 [Penicillium canariense]KAJ5168657.1 hypothetical protein N7482_004251 [Penicillium canariense]
MFSSSLTYILVTRVLPLLLLVRISHGFLRRWRQQHKAGQLGCKPIPLEPTRWPFGIDVLLRLLEADRQERTPDFIVERYNAMGPRYTWRTRMLGSEHYTTADPKNIQAILATQFNDFGMGQARSRGLKTVLGRSIFAVDGPEWHSAREVVRPIFSREQVSDLSLLERHLQRMLLCMPGEPDGWTRPVSLASLIPCLTIDSATELFLGKSSDSLLVRLREEQHHQQKDFHWAFERVQELLSKRLRLRNLYWLYGTREIKECVNILHEFCDQAIADAGQADQGNKKRYDLLEALISRSPNPSEVRDHVLGLLAAGRDTTASLLSWVFYCLIRHPAIFDKLRRVILDTFGPYHENQVTITFERLKSCTYLQHVLCETLRLHSVVPFNSRRALRDTTLPSGGGPDGTAPVFIPAGQEVNFSTHVLHRRHDIWGPDADDFIPERWEGKRPGWTYVPFNGGPRICIGQQFALTEAGYVISRMLQRFDRIQGLDVDPTRDWHHFTIICSPGPGHESVKARLRIARDD